MNHPDKPGGSEVAMKALKNVHPVTHAIGNTMRRVVIMLICIAVFRTPMSLAGAVGSAVAIGGSYIYAMVKTSEKEASEKEASEKEASEKEASEKEPDRAEDSGASKQLRA